MTMIEIKPLLPVLAVNSVVKQELKIVRQGSNDEPEKILRCGL